MALDTHISAFISGEDFAAINDWCKNNDRTFSYFVRQALDEKLHREGYRSKEE